MPQSVEKALQIPSDHQKRILEHMLRDTTSILKDKGTILEGLLACQKFAAYEDEAYALRNSVAGSSSSAGGNFDMLGMSAKLTSTDKHRLRAFVDESLETVTHWIQDILSVTTLRPPIIPDESASCSRRSSTIIHPSPNTPSNELPRYDTDPTHGSKPKHNSRGLRTCLLFGDCSRCSIQGFRVYTWFLKHFRDKHLISFETTHVHAGSREYVCSGIQFTTPDALACHVWETYMVPVQTTKSAQVFHAPSIAPSTTLSSGISTPVLPASQAHVDPLFSRLSRAGHTPTSAPVSSSVQPSHYQASYPSNNMPANTLSFSQSLHYPTNEDGMPLPYPNGNFNGYADYTGHWDPRTQ